MGIILANCVLLAFFDPLDVERTGSRNTAIENAETPFMVIFTVDMVIKMVALDLFGQPSSYFSDSWNWCVATCSTARPAILSGMM